jgi:hypothetical protein
LKNLIIVAGAVLIPSLALAQGSPLSGARGNWGQEVKAANQGDLNSYPGGTNRGGYVSGQARDGDGPGYGREIQSLGVGQYSNAASGKSLGADLGSQESSR